METPHTPHHIFGDLQRGPAHTGARCAGRGNNWDRGGTGWILQIQVSQTKLSHVVSVAFRVRQSPYHFHSSCRGPTAFCVYGYDLTTTLRPYVQYRDHPPRGNTSDVHLQLRGLAPVFSLYCSSICKICNLQLLVSCSLHIILPLTKSIYVALFYQQEDSTWRLQKQNLILCLTKPRFRSPSIDFPLFSTVRLYLTYSYICKLCGN